MRCRESVDSHVRVSTTETTTRSGNYSLTSSTPKPRCVQFDPRNPTSSHIADTFPSGFSIYTLIGTYVSALVGQKCAQAGSPPHKSHLITCWCWASKSEQPNGHAATHAMQRTQTSVLIS